MILGGELLGSRNPLALLSMERLPSSSQLTLQSAFFGNRSSVLSSPPTHLQPHIFHDNHLLSSSCFSYKSKPTNPLVLQYSATCAWMASSLFSPSSSHSFRFIPFPGGPMVGSLIVPRQIVAFGGALKSYQIISSYFVQCESGSHDSFSGRGSGGTAGSALRCISDSRHSRVASRVRLKPASLRLHSERERIRGPWCYRTV
jgi:hypothetical protein